MKFNNVVDTAYQYIKQYEGKVSSEDAVNAAIQSSGHELSSGEKQEALDMIVQARTTFYPEKR